MCKYMQPFINLLFAVDDFCEGVQVNLSTTCCTFASDKKIVRRAWEYQYICGSTFLTGILCSVALNCISVCCQHYLGLFASAAVTKAPRVCICNPAAPIKPDSQTRVDSCSICC